MSYPVDSNARQRLFAAQRAEAVAVRDAESALRARDRVAQRLAPAADQVRAARRAVGATSGAARAARLLGLDEAALKREVRHSTETLPRD